jgi:flagellar basal-body rod protein FlgC
MAGFDIFDIAGSGMSAQSVRLNTVASNLANADSVSSDPNSVYQAKHPVFQAVMGSGENASEASVKVAGIAQSQAAAEARYDPGNPLADAQGYVYAPGVNVV